MPRIHFDRHLYLPLIFKRGDWPIADPPPLEESEARFVRDLRAYWEAEKEKSLAGKEVFLFQERSQQYDYIKELFTRQLTRRCA